MKVWLDRAPGGVRGCLPSFETQEVTKGSAGSDSKQPVDCDCRCNLRRRGIPGLSASRSCDPCRGTSGMLDSFRTSVAFG